MANTTIQAASKINAATKSQSSQGLIIQNYSNSVLQQPNVDFSGFKNLLPYQTQINTGLGKAQGHAKTYLNTIQPSIITNVTNINNYYQLHNAVATTLPPGSTTKEWIAALNTLKDQSSQYLSDTNGVIASLKTLNTSLGTDTASFNLTVTNLNAAVNGDNGVLKSIDGQLGTIQGKIDGAIAGIAISGLAILGGVFITAVGAVADFVTAGASTPVVVGGVALIAAGVGGEVASAVTLSNLNNEKAKLLREKSTLTAEVNLALGIKGGYSSLANQAGAAMNAATQMQNAWEFLGGDLSNLINDLEKGTTSSGEVRKIWLTAANSTVASVLKDTNIIKTQMSGTKQLVAPKGENIGDYIVSVAKNGATPQARAMAY